MSSDIYDIRKYSDEECYRVLGFTNNPSDMELEQSLLQQINKYSSIRTSNANKLHIFFQSMYNRFFEDDDDDDDDEDDDEEQNTIYEGFQTKPMDQVNEYDFTSPQAGISYEDVSPDAYYGEMGNIGGATNILQEDERFNEDGIVVSTNGDESNGDESKGAFGAQRIITKDIDYTPGQLNQILKETIKRTININSQDRDDVFEQNNSLTTDFHFYLEETLKNVVSMKLYAVQIPFTWYTIDDSLGANLIFLKSDTPGLQGDKHQYKLEIQAGNYKSNALVSAVNAKLQELKESNLDVNFFDSGFTYDTTDAKCTMNLNIQKIYDTKEFQMSFDSNDSIDTSYNILGTYLGFDKDSTITLNDKRSFLKTNTNTNTKQSKSEQIKIVRYSVAFDSSGRMLDISNNIQLDGTLPNEEELLDIIIPSSETNETVSQTINAYIRGNAYINGTVDISNDKWHWNLDYNRDAGFPILYQKLAIRIDSSSNTDFFGLNVSNQSNFPKYINLHCTDISGEGMSPYEYVIETTRPVVSEGLYDVSGMYITLYNKSARNNFGLTNLSFVDRVDVRIDISDSDNSDRFFEVSEFISYIGEELVRKSNNNNDNYRISSLGDTPQDFRVQDEVTGEDLFAMNIDVSFLLQGSGDVFDLSGIDNDTSNSIVCDFSGLLHDVYLFRTSNTTYDISSTFGPPLSPDISAYVDTGKYPRTTVDVCANTYTYTYTSLHPQLANTYNKNDNYVLRLKGNAVFPDLDLSFNLNDLSGKQLVNITTDISNEIHAQGMNLGIDIQFTTEQILSETLGSYGYVIQEITTAQYYQSAKNNAIFKSTLTISISRTFSLSDYEVRFEGELWNSILQLDSSYNGNDIIRGNAISYDNRFIGEDQYIKFDSIVSSDIVGMDSIFIRIEQETNGGDAEQNGFLIEQLIGKINSLFKDNQYLYGSYMETFDRNGIDFIRLYVNTTRIFTTNDYRLVLYDSESFEKCSKSTNYFRTTKSNTTLGYILGFRKLTEYEFTMENYDNDGSSSGTYFDVYTNRTTNNDFTRDETEDESSGLITEVSTSLKADTVVSVSLYNSLMIVLEDYNQNHMNDGLVTVTQRDTKASLPYYALRNIYNCNPETSEVLNSGLYGKNLTSKQIYSLNQIINAQNTVQSKKNKTTSLKDIFAIVPVKYGLNAGDIFVEFGGTLQAQERAYFGPVNISRLRVKLLTDKGDVINLNGADWSFQIICETLYKQPT